MTDPSPRERMLLAMSPEAASRAVGCEFKEAVFEDGKLVGWRTVHPLDMSASSTLTRPGSRPSRSTATRQAEADPLAP